MGVTYIMVFLAGASVQALIFWCCQADQVAAVERVEAAAADLGDRVRAWDDLRHLPTVTPPAYSSMATISQETAPAVSVLIRC